VTKIWSIGWGFLKFLVTKNDTTRAGGKYDVSELFTNVQPKTLWTSPVLMFNLNLSLNNILIVSSF
jgi:hypothetical protein